MIIMLGICYWSTGHDDKTNKTLFKLFKEVSGQQNLVFKGNLNYLGIFGEYNTVAKVLHQVPGMH